MTNFSWVVEWMQCKPVDGNYSNVVICVGWRCNGEDGSATSTAYGSASFAAPGDPFVPYDQLTEAQVLDWCWSDGGVDRAEVEAQVGAEIENKLNPPVVQVALPWRA